MADDSMTDVTDLNANNSSDLNTDDVADLNANDATSAAGVKAAAALVVWS